MHVLMTLCEPAQAADKYLTEVLSQAAAHVASEPVPDVLADVRKGGCHAVLETHRPPQQPIQICCGKSSSGHIQACS